LRGGDVLAAPDASDAPTPSQKRVPDGHGADDGLDLIVIVCRELSAKTDEPLFPRHR
jgi:hypothetical protein